MTHWKSGDSAILSLTNPSDSLRRWKVGCQIRRRPLNVPIRRPYRRSCLRVPRLLPICITEMGLFTTIRRSYRRLRVPRMLPIRIIEKVSNATIRMSYRRSRLPVPRLLPIRILSFEKELGLLVYHRLALLPKVGQLQRQFPGSVHPILQTVR